VFPPFWILGMIILVSPLRPTPEWEMGKTQEERIMLLDRIRTAEVKWARRCLWATLALFALISSVILTVVFAVLRK
jgi:hypothetical protein